MLGPQHPVDQAQQTAEFLIIPAVKSTDLKELRDRCLSITEPLTKAYVWYQDDFNLHIDPVKGVLRGRLQFGDNVEDEWFVVSLLKRISSSLGGDVAVRVTDEDGEILLIEAADQVPRWAQEPTVADGRVFIYEGRIHLLPPENENFEEEELLRERALERLKSPDENTEANSRVQKAIVDRLGSYPDEFKKETHYTHFRLPVKAAKILQDDISLISSAVHAVADIDPSEAKICREMAVFKQEEEVTVGLRLPRCLYAKLNGVSLWPYKKSGWSLPPKDDSYFANCHRGFKLTSGLELIHSHGKNLKDSTSDQEDISVKDPGFLRFVETLKKKSYFRNLLEGSKEYLDLLEKARQYYSTQVQSEDGDEAVSTEVKRLKAFKFYHANLPEDLSEIKAKFESRKLNDPESEDWLNVSQDQFDEMLSKHFGMASSTSKSKSGGFADKEDSLFGFLKKSSDMKGVEETDKNKGNQAREMDNRDFHFEPNELRMAFEKLLQVSENGGDRELDSDDDSFDYESEELDEPDEEMMNYFREMSQQLKGNQVNEDMDVMKNLLESLENQEGPQGPVSTLFQSMNKEK